MIFAMVSTKRSVPYTELSLPSFFQHTTLAEDDRVLLIVNEPGAMPDFARIGVDRSRLTIIEHDAPKGFAQNMNIALREASPLACGVVSLNNDIVFTPSWLAPIVQDDAITLPSCNQQYSYDFDGLRLSFLMTIDDFAGRQTQLNAIAADHVAAHAREPWRRDLLMPFYCAHIPYKVYATIGLFDENFGSGGGEDVDYRIRAMLAGFDVRYATGSFVLHFMGMSTWRSGEDAVETSARDVDYRTRFTQKWGEALRSLLLTGYDTNAMARKLGVEDLVAQRDYLEIVNRLMAGEAKPAATDEPVSTPLDPPRRRLCLNMIVKNEKAIIERCLLSVVDQLACWVIGDTGSTDETPELIERFFEARGIPGELHRFPFQNFEQARNEALTLARASTLEFDYILFLDADMELTVQDPAFADRLTASAYRVRQRAGITYWNVRLLKHDTPGGYRGVTHEYLEIMSGHTEDLSGIEFIDHASGSNRVDKFERDIRMLLDGISQAPNVARYHFYLAQSYRDAGKHEEAARTYAHRGALGGWDEEVWYSKLQEARCYRKLGRDGDFVATAIAAYNMRPHRAEPLWDLANYYRHRGMNHAGAMVCEAGLDLPYPAGDALFIEDDVYNGALKEEFSILANYARRPAQKDKGRQICDEIATSRSMPENRRATARRNLIFYARNIAEIATGVDFKRLEHALEPGWAMMNPSIAVWREELFLIQRTVNYTMEGTNYFTPANVPVMTRNYLAALTPSLDFRTWAEIVPSPALPEPLFTPVQGLEDMRLIPLGDELWCCSTVREMNREGWCEQYLARIERADEAHCRLVDGRLLTSPFPRQHEKNWMPQVIDGAIRFIYSYDGNIVVSTSGQTVRNVPSRLAVDHLRGGSQAIPFDGGWLSVCHEVVRWGDTRQYLHRFTWFDHATVLTTVSEPFKLSSQHVEFVAGLALHPDGERLILSYGVADRESWLASVPVAEVRRLLGPSAGL